MKIVSPFRPFPPESDAHRRLGAFDWLTALSMLRDSARTTCGCDTFAITDVDTDLPVPSHRYETTHRRLMLWILEVSALYLESDDFDQDTVMLSPDVLVFGDLRRWFSADLGVVVRLEPKFEIRPILNCAQWWRHDAKSSLARFYRDALAIAETLPDGDIVWGADTIPLTQLLAPLSERVVYRHGLSVRCIPHTDVLFQVTSAVVTAMDRCQYPIPDRPIVDFKYLAKRRMRNFFEASFSRRVAR